MKKRVHFCPCLRILVAGILLVFVVPTTYAKRGVLVVDESMNNKTLTVSKGQKLLIELPAQFGEGSSWAVVKNESSDVLRHEPEPNAGSTDRPGGRQAQRFEFLAVEEGATDLSFQYKQQWNKQSSPQKTFRLHVIVGH